MIQMNTQNYCMVNLTTNICDNIVLWDGNPEIWTPPEGYLMLVQVDTLARVWGWDSDAQTWALIEEVGVGSIGFTWDGAALTTNLPEPPPKVAAPDQPVVTGAQTL